MLSKVIMMLIYMSDSRPISQSPGYLALCLWLTGKPNWCHYELQLEV